MSKLRVAMQIDLKGRGGGRGVECHSYLVLFCVEGRGSLSIVSLSQSLAWWRGVRGGCLRSETTPVSASDLEEPWRNSNGEISLT